MFKKKESKKIESEEFKLGFNAFKKYFKGQKKTLLLFFILSSCLSFMISVTAFVTGKILDSLINLDHINFFNSTISNVWFWFFILVFSGTIQRVFRIYIFNYKIPIISNKMFVNFYQERFSKILIRPTSFFKTMGMGKVIYSINTGAKSYSEILFLFIRLIAYPVQIVFFLLFLFFLSWKVGILVLFFLIISFFYFMNTIEKKKKVITDFNKSNKIISSFLTEKINLVFEIKKNNKEKLEKVNLNKSFEGNFQQSFFSQLKFKVKNNIIFTLIFFILLILTWVFIIFLFQAGEITAGAILSISIYARLLVPLFQDILEIFNVFIEKFVLIGDAEKLLQNIPENYEEKKTRVDVKGEVEFKNVDFGYDKNTEYTKNKKVFSLQNINLKINKGQKVAFVGQSGGGKSTSVELVGGFYFPEKGDVLIDKVSTKEINLNDLRSSIAYVSQDIAIFNTTVKENISYGLNDEENLTEKEKTKKIQHAAKLANISEFIDSLPDGYDTKVGEKGLKLSGGQKQRIAIARAILRNPKILILDEPTSALDIESETKITSALKEVMKNRTTIIIAHRISTVRDAEKIFVFKEGKIVEEGNYQELISKKGEFKKMVELHKGLE